MKKLSHFFTALMIAIILVAPVTASAKTGIGDDTLNSLKERVASLRTKVDGANTLIESHRVEISKIEVDISNAKQIADDLIANFQKMADEFQTDGDYQKTLKKAQADLQIQIERFSNGSETQKTVAKQLQGVLDNFEDLDKRRDQALQQALKEIRRLEANKEDIEALIVLDDYKRMESLLTEMVVAFEESVEEAKAVNDAVASASDLPTE